MNIQPSINSSDKEYILRIVVSQNEIDLIILDGLHRVNKTTCASYQVQLTISCGPFEVAAMENEERI